MSEENKRLSPQAAETWRLIVRDLIKHENDLVNQRLTWLIQVEGLLFAALAFAWQKAPPSLTILFSILGIAVALSLQNAISMYSPAVRELKHWWDKHGPEEFIGWPEVVGLWSPASGMWRFLRPWRALPVIFIIAWIGVLAVSLA